MTKAKTITIELTLQEAVTLWGYLDVRPIGESAETLRWVRDRLARQFSEAVDTNIESEHAAQVGYESFRRRKAVR
jgi:hypothetical protein